MIVERISSRDPEEILRGISEKFLKHQVELLEKSLDPRWSLLRNPSAESQELLEKSQIGFYDGKSG